MNTKPGPWMKDALDIVMAWQMRNPDITDPAQAIEAVKSSKNSELPSLLATHVLELIIRPLFSQAKSESTSTSKWQRAADGSEWWKDTKNQAAMDLLRWTVSVLDEKSVEVNWKLLYPPLLKLLDDTEIHLKVQGCLLLTTLLRTVRPSFLSYTSLGPVFETTLRPFLTYLPTLTPEQDSAALLDATLPTIVQLAEVMYSDTAAATPDISAIEKKRMRLLNDIVHDGILAPLRHAPASTYPELGITVLSHLPPLLSKLGIHSVRHLQAILQELSEILQNPFVLAKPDLALVTLRGLKSVIENAWPRIGEHRALVMLGVVRAWWRCCEEKNGQDINNVKEGLREIVGMLDAVLAVDDTKKEEWEKEKQDIIRASKKMEELFGKSVMEGQ